MAHTLDPLVRELYPFASHYLPLGEARMHYVDEGPRQCVDGPMLLVHGNPTWSFMFRRLISEHSATRRVIAPDHVGCGLSDKPQQYRYRMGRHVANLEQLVLKLDLHDITLVVHDWGGPIGLSVAVRHPARFKRLVISNTAAFRSNRMPWLLKVARMPGVGEPLIRGLNAFVLTTLQTSAARPIRGAVRKGYVWPYRSWHDRIATARFVQDIPLSAEDPSYPELLALERGLPGLRDLPTLLLWGERDWVFSTHFLDRFREWFPEATVRTAAQAHHLLYEDEPEFVASSIRELLQ